LDRSGADLGDAELLLLVKSDVELPALGPGLVDKSNANAFSTARSAKRNNIAESHDTFSIVLVGRYLGYARCQELRDAVVKIPLPFFAEET